MPKFVKNYVLNRGFLHFENSFHKISKTLKGQGVLLGRVGLPKHTYFGLSSQVRITDCLEYKYDIDVSIKQLLLRAKE